MAPKKKGVSAPSIFLQVFRTSILIRNAMIAEISPNVRGATDAVILNLAGKHVTPGVIDVHSHMGANRWMDPNGGPQFKFCQEVEMLLAGKVLFINCVARDRDVPAPTIQAKQFWQASRPDCETRAKVG